MACVKYWHTAKRFRNATLGRRERVEWIDPVTDEPEWNIFVLAMPRAGDFEGLSIRLRTRWSQTPRLGPFRDGY